MTRPANDARHLDAALPELEFFATERSRRTVGAVSLWVTVEHLWPIVGGEEYKGIFREAELVERGQQAPDRQVKVGDIGEILCLVDILSGRVA